MKVKIEEANAKAKNQRRKLLRQRSIQAAEDYEGIVASLKEDLETYLDVLKNNSQVFRAITCTRTFNLARMLRFEPKILS